jgi:malonate transporter
MPGCRPGHSTGPGYNGWAMLAIFATTFPFFALVLCGYIAVRRQMLPQLAIPGLNGFVLYFALPCLLFRFGAATPIAELFDPGVLLVYTLSALAIVGLAVGLARRSGLDWNNSAFGALLAAFPNTGFMGVPLLVTLLGDKASGPVIITIAIDLIVTTSLCVALSRLGQAGKGAANGSLAAFKLAIKGMLRNPMPWAIALGALASLLQLALPAPLSQTIGLLADAASPVALFTIGAMLARAQLATPAPLPAQPGGLAGGVAAMALAKLVLHPLLMAGIGHLAIAAGLPLSPFALLVLILVACLPSAGNVAMLAERFGADTGRVARIILVSTALSFFSFSAAIALLK